MGQRGPRRRQIVPGRLQARAGVQEHAYQAEWQCGPSLQYLGLHSQISCCEKTLDQLANRSIDWLSRLVVVVSFVGMIIFLQEFIDAQSSP